MHSHCSDISLTLPFQELFEGDNFTRVFTAFAYVPFEPRRLRDDAGVHLRFQTLTFKLSIVESFLPSRPPEPRRLLISVRSTSSCSSAAGSVIYS